MLRRTSTCPISSPYDAASFDVPQILRQMMFYQASGGQKYAGLLNRNQHFVDLSNQLDLNRGVLIGFCRQQAGTLQRSVGKEWETVRGPEDSYWTCYRFVIPIARKRGGQ